MRKSTFIIIAATVIIVAGASIWRFAGSSSFGSSRPFLQDGWQYRWGISPVDTGGNPIWAYDLSAENWHPMQFPGQPPGRSGSNTLWLKVDVPSKDYVNPALFLRFVRQNFVLYYNGQPVYQYGTMPASADERFQPWLPFHVVLLPQDFAGGTLVFQISSAYPSIGIHSPVELESHEVLLSNKVMDDLFKIINSVSMIFAGMWALVIYLRSRHTGYLFFGGYALMVALMNFGGSFVKQYYWNAPSFWTNIVIFSGAAMPAFWMGFLHTLTEQVYRTSVRRALWLIIACNGALYLLFLYNPMWISWVSSTILFSHIFGYLLMWRVLLPRRQDLSVQIYIAGATISICLLLGDVLLLNFFPYVHHLQGAYGQFLDAIALAIILGIRYITMKRANDEYSLAVREKNVQLQEMQGQLEEWNADLEEMIACRTEELESQKSNWQQLFSNSPHAIAILDGDGRLMEINSTFVQWFRYTLEEVRNRYIYSFLLSPGTLAADIGEEWLRHSGKLDYESVFRSNDGRAIPVSMILYHYQTLSDQHGFYCILSDISDRKQAEASLLNSERKYRMIAENTGDVIWTADLSGRLTYISPAVQHLLGYTPEQCKTISLAALLDEQAAVVTRETIFQATKALYAGQMNAVIESGLLRSDDIVVWTESIINLQRNEADEILGFLGVTRDITERHRAEEKIRQPYALYLRNEFFNRILHGTLSVGLELFAMAIRYQIYLPGRYSVYCLQLEEPQAKIGLAARDTSVSAALADYIHHQEGLSAWETTEGIGILVSQDGTTDPVTKDKEMDEATELMRQIADKFPGLSGRLGIALYMEGDIRHLSRRYRQAKDTALRGKQFWPEQRVYHFLDCGVLQVLSPFAEAEEATAFVKQTLGDLIEYDHDKQSDLVRTLEKIIHSDSLKNVAEEMYLHPKTVIQRKQRIEKILGVSLDAFEVKLKLGVALKLLHMNEKTGEPL